MIYIFFPSLERVEQIEASGAGKLKYEKISKGALEQSSKDSSHATLKESITIEKRSFEGKFAVTWNEYESKYVGAKSRNVADLRGKLSDWIKLPASIAIPYGKIVIYREYIRLFNHPFC